MNDNIYCYGVECPIRKACLRFTNGRTIEVNDGMKIEFIRKCTSQKKYIKNTKVVDRK